MKKIFAMIFLLVLFFLALTPEWSILSLGKVLAESDFAIYIIQSFVVLITVIGIVFIFFNLPFLKKVNK